MSRFALPAALLAVFFAHPAPISAQNPAPNPAPARTVSLEFSEPDLIPANWTLEIHPDGSGHFRSRRGSAPRMDGEWIEPADLDREIRVSSRFAAHVFEVAAAERYFQKDCESHAKVAFTGTKRFRYFGPGSGPDSGANTDPPVCTFNYSKYKDLQDLSDEFQSVATTLIEAARIERLRQHDRLGLDHELQSLSEMARDGRATELIAIHDELVSLANDESLMERIRRRARELLAKAGN
jgi:hypothetical protein